MAYKVAIAKHNYLLEVTDPRLKTVENNEKHLKIQIVYQTNSPQTTLNKREANCLVFLVCWQVFKNNLQHE